MTELVLLEGDIIFVSAEIANINYLKEVKELSNDEDINNLYQSALRMMATQIPYMRNSKTGELTPLNIKKEN